MSEDRCSSNPILTPAACAAALALALALACGCGQATADQAQAVRATMVRTVRPELRTFQRVVVAHGNVMPVQYAEICSRIDGVLDAVTFDEGDAVREGEVLFQTDKVSLENQVEVARQDLKVAETEVRQAEINVEVAILQASKAHTDADRARVLISSQAISQDQFEITSLNAQRADAVKAQAEAALAHARARLEQMASNLAIAIKTLADSRVKANFSGVVTMRFKEPGEYADKAKPVLRMEDPSGLEFQAAISAEHYEAVRPGETKLVLHSLEGAPWGEVPVTYRAPSIDLASRTFTLKARLPAGGPYVSGMLCVGELILAQREGKGVPEAAVLPRADGRHTLLVVAGGRAKAVGVTPGLRTDGFAEIVAADEPIDGLSVICQGQAFLDDGAPVKVAADPANTTKAVAGKPVDQ